MVKLALFDFCETLVDFQTADAFIDYVREKKSNVYMVLLNIISDLLIKLKIVAILNKLFPERSLGKRIKLFQIRHLSYDSLDNLAALFYRDMIKPNLIIPLMSELNRLSNQGYEVCLVSAGYSIYLKYFAQEHHIQHIIATEIAFNKINNRCLGTISGKDCINMVKVSRLKTHFAGKDVNYNESISYSDSEKDLPLLQLTGMGVIVSRVDSQLWGKPFGLKEILWSIK